MEYIKLTYEEIFILGWNLNLLMFLTNLALAIRTMNQKSREQLLQENEVLSELKAEFDFYYPYRKYETLVTYLIPFTAFFRMSYRIFEMLSFFSKNKGTTLIDYMIYKYRNDIELAKNKIK